MISVIGTGTCQEHMVSLEQPMVHDLWSLTKVAPYICLFFVGFGNQKAVASHSLSMRMVYLLWSWELMYCDLIPVLEIGSNMQEWMQDPKMKIWAWSPNPIFWADKNTFRSAHHVREVVKVLKHPDHIRIANLLPSETNQFSRYVTCPSCITSYHPLKQNRCRIASASRSPKDPMLTPGGRNSRVPINRDAWKLALVEKRTYAERNRWKFDGRSSSIEISGIQSKKPTRSNNINWNDVIAVRSEPSQRMYQKKVKMGPWQ